MLKMSIIKNAYFKRYLFDSPLATQDLSLLNLRLPL